MKYKYLKIAMAIITSLSLISSSPVFATASDNSAQTNQSSNALTASQSDATYTDLAVNVAKLLTGGNAVGGSTNVILKNSISTEAENAAKLATKLGITSDDTNWNSPVSAAEAAGAISKAANLNSDSEKELKNSSSSVSLSQISTNGTAGNGGKIGNDGAIEMSDNSGTVIKVGNSDSGVYSVGAIDISSGQLNKTAGTVGTDDTNPNSVGVYCLKEVNMNGGKPVSIANQSKGNSFGISSSGDSTSIAGKNSTATVIVAGKKDANGCVEFENVTLSYETGFGSANSSYNSAQDRPTTTTNLSGTGTNNTTSTTIKDFYAGILSATDPSNDLNVDIVGNNTIEGGSDGSLLFGIVTLNDLNLTQDSSLTSNSSGTSNTGIYSRGGLTIREGASEVNQYLQNSGTGTNNTTSNSSGTDINTAKIKISASPADTTYANSTNNSTAATNFQQTLAALSNSPANQSTGFTKSDLASLTLKAMTLENKSGSTWACDNLDAKKITGTVENVLGGNSDSKDDIGKQVSFFVSAGANGNLAVIDGLPGQYTGSDGKTTFSSQGAATTTTSKVSDWYTQSFIQKANTADTTFDNPQLTALYENKTGTLDGNVKPSANADSNGNYFVVTYPTSGSENFHAGAVKVVHLRNYTTKDTDGNFIYIDSDNNVIKLTADKTVRGYGISNYGVCDITTEGGVNGDFYFTNDGKKLIGYSPAEVSDIANAVSSTSMHYDNDRDTASNDDTASAFDFDLAYANGIITVTSSASDMYYKDASGNLVKLSSAVLNGSTTDAISPFIVTGGAKAYYEHALYIVTSSVASGTNISVTLYDSAGNSVTKSIKVQ